MTEIRYCGLTLSPPVQTVQGMGTVFGPGGLSGGGDGWIQLASLPAADMPSGTSEYVIHVRGKIGNLQVIGSGMQLGMLQLCFGTTGGLRHPSIKTSHPVTRPLPGDEGVVFEFLVHINGTFPDPLLGSSWNPAGTQFCLWARTFLNNDAFTYAATFDVCDVAWLWWDVGRIPAGHWAGDYWEVLTAMPSSPPGAATRLSSTFGNDGERWLHFVSVRYQVGGPISPSLPAPTFRFGVTPDGTHAAFINKLGSFGTWGLRRTPNVGVGGPELPQMHHGGIFQHAHTTSTTKAGFYVHAGNATPFDYIRRYSHFAVRIDTLTDLRFREDPGLVLLGGAASGNWWEGPSLLVERPADGLLTEPIVIMTAVPRFASNLPAGVGARVYEDPASNRWFGEHLLPQFDPSVGEACGVAAYGRRVFQTLSPAMQWHASLVSSAAVPLFDTRQSFDHSFVAFHPVRDPENVTVPPGTKPPPIVIYPGRQSASPNDLQAPPKPYTAQIVRRGEPLRSEINGPIGYRKRWPLGGKPTAFYAVTWPAMVAADADAVMKFLRGNPAWQLRTPAGVVVAALNASPPQLEPSGSDPKLARVSVEVAVLVWTGP